MRPADPFLAQVQLRSLLEDLGQEVAASGREVAVYVVGGAAMVLTDIRTDRLTQDVDLVVLASRADREHLLACAVQVARRRRQEIPDLPENWLNDRVTAFTAMPTDDPNATRMDVGGLQMRIASPERLLAMKLAAGREKDREDTLALLQITGVQTREEISAVLRQTFGERIDSGPPEGIDEQDTLLFAEEFLRLAAQRRTPSVVPPTLPAAAMSTGRPAPQTCGQWMPRARRACARPAGHRPPHQ